MFANSHRITECQGCKSKRTPKPRFFAGYLPSVNRMTPGLVEEPFFPAQLVECPDCTLVQLDTLVDAGILFPPHYPYQSGSTALLKRNFAELANQQIPFLKTDDLVVDIGSNDGTLLANFIGRSTRVLGIEPTDNAKIAADKGIPTLQKFFNMTTAREAVDKVGKASLITACNVFAHMPHLDEIMNGVNILLKPGGLFVTESHYLLSLLKTLQYDTIYHEHLRYYSLTSLQHLFSRHGFCVLSAKEIPTHGGSIRVVAMRVGEMGVPHPNWGSVHERFDKEKQLLTDEGWSKFSLRVQEARRHLMLMLYESVGETYGVGAPSRATTLIHYLGLDTSLLKCVCELPGSPKVGLNIPGTNIPVVSEQKLIDDQPDQALILSWHLADEIIPKLRQKGYEGKFIVPLPVPRMV